MHHFFPQQGISDLPAWLQYKTHQDDRFRDSGQWLFHHNTHFIIPHKAALHIKYKWRDITHGDRLGDEWSSFHSENLLFKVPQKQFCIINHNPWNLWALRRPQAFILPSWQSSRYSGLHGATCFFSRFPAQLWGITELRRGSRQAHARRPLFHFNWGLLRTKTVKTLTHKCSLHSCNSLTSRRVLLDLCLAEWYWFH